MQIKILGIGGAINDGLPYNSFMIGGRTLIEAPPDIMISLQNHAVDFHAIETVYVSHFHADHYFGLPFLLLSLFVDARAQGAEKHIHIIGSHDVADKTLSLLEIAFSTDHPCMRWAKESIVFTEIDECAAIELLPGYTASFFKMNHFVDTYGFILTQDDCPIFAYTADTLWCNSLETMLSLRPKIVLADSNGEKTDVVPVHLSKDDIEKRALALTKNTTKFYLTHLCTQRAGTEGNITYAEAGMKFDIGR